MQLAEPVASSWKASLSLEFGFADQKTTLSRKVHDGPLVVQKPLYPEGHEVCHAIVVHPPGGIAGGDELSLQVKTGNGASTLLTTPGAAKWYRSAGPWAKQSVAFDVQGALEWLPQETIVFDGALAESAYDVYLGAEAGFIGWDIVCLGRTGSGERFTRGSHSSCPCTPNAMRCLACAPAERYHFAAPGVVSSTDEFFSVFTCRCNSSPPAMPPGGCTTIAWQTASPSG